MKCKKPRRIRKTKVKITIIEIDRNQWLNNSLINNVSYSLKNKLRCSETTKIIVIFATLNY